MRQANATLAATAPNKSYFVTFGTFVIADAFEAGVTRRNIGSRLDALVFRPYRAFFRFITDNIVDKPQFNTRPRSKVMALDIL